MQSSLSKVAPWVEGGALAFGAHQVLATGRQAQSAADLLGEQQRAFGRADELNCT